MITETRLFYKLSIFPNEIFLTLDEFDEIIKHNMITLLTFVFFMTIGMEWHALYGIKDGIIVLMTL